MVLAMAAKKLTLQPYPGEKILHYHEWLLKNDREMFSGT